MLRKIFETFCITEHTFPGVKAQRAKGWKGDYRLIPGKKSVVPILEYKVVEAEVPKQSGRSGLSPELVVGLGVAGGVVLTVGTLYRLKFPNVKIL